MRAIVVIPTYNERDNLGPLVAEVLAQRGVAAVIVVDDGSPDGTGQVAEDLRRATGRVEVIHRPAKLGLGTAYRAGFHRALEMGAERVLTMDADFSHRPDHIGRLLDADRGTDLAIGSRYVPGGAIVNWEARRRWLSRGANFVARAALGLRARDCTSGFRCYQADLLRRVDLAAIRSSDYSFLVEILFIFQRQGATIAEVPIVFEDRRAGASKISRTEIWRAMRTVARLSGRRVGRRPAARPAPHAAGRPTA